jgi:drug/metabolite transporter (DMT)-like permease
MSGSPSGPAVRPTLGIAISVTSVSTAAILIRFSSADPLAIAAFRMALATLIISPIAAYRGLGDLAGLSRKEFLALLGVGACLAAHFALWIASLFYTTVAASVLLVSTSPIFVVILGELLLGERSTKRVWLGICVAMGGVLVMIAPGGGLAGSLGGYLMSLGGAVAVAFYLIGGRRFRQKLSLTSYVLLVYGAASLALMASCLVARVQLVGLEGKEYLVFLILAIVPSHLGHTFFNYLLKFLDARVISVSTLGEPIISSILAFFILQEVPHLAVFVGAPLVLLGVYLAARGSWPMPTRGLQR